MSLKFGIYLVEQRVISPEQFCGLVKIQQESTMSLPTISLRKNILTIKQVAQVLGEIEHDAEKTFIQSAMELDFLNRVEADQILQFQQEKCQPLRKLIVKCGLLSQRQCSILFLYFERHGAKASPPVSAAKPINIRTESHEKSTV
ncbi:hypothetical protein N9B43_06475, partial [Mariniblastus sp.]|nr:hypothetical protein [Mariniblastus sp.]